MTKQLLSENRKALQFLNHASDLYLRRTPAAIALVNRLENRSLLSVFRDPDGQPWYELPFCFAPYWDNPSKYH